MLELYELEETRFYQEVSADVLKKDHQRYLERLLNNRLGTPTSTDTLQQRLQVIQNLLILKGDQFFDLTTALARENSKLCLVEILAVRFQNIPESVMAKVEKVENSTKENWIWLALTAESIAAFAEAIGIENDSLNLLNPSNPT